MDCAECDFYIDEDQCAMRKARMKNCFFKADRSPQTAEFLGSNSTPLLNAKAVKQWLSDNSSQVLIDLETSTEDRSFMKRYVGDLQKAIIAIDKLAL